MYLIEFEGSDQLYFKRSEPHNCALELPESPRPSIIKCTLSCNWGSRDRYPNYASFILLQSDTHCLECCENHANDSSYDWCHFTITWRNKLAGSSRFLFLIIIFHIWQTTHSQRERKKMEKFKFFRFRFRLVYDSASNFWFPEGHTCSYPSGLRQRLSNA